MTKAVPRAEPGAKLAEQITAVSPIDEGGRDPVHIVWNHAAWCPMCCKLFKKPSQAKWEVRALRRLSHPGIVRLLENGAPRYLLTEFLEGPSLHKLIRSRPTGHLARISHRK